MKQHLNKYKSKSTLSIAVIFCCFIFVASVINGAEFPEYSLSKSLLKTSPPLQRKQVQFGLEEKGEGSLSYAKSSSRHKKVLHPHPFTREYISHIKYIDERVAQIYQKEMDAARGDANKLKALLKELDEFESELQGYYEAVADVYIQDPMNKYEFVTKRPLVLAKEMAENNMDSIPLLRRQIEEYLSQLHEKEIQR